jgi:hypothetical protein
VECCLETGTVPVEKMWAAVKDTRRSDLLLFHIHVTFISQRTITAV